MRMVVELSIMGVQHGGRRKLCFELGVALTEAAQCLDGGPEQQVIEHVRLPISQRPQR